VNQVEVFFGSPLKIVHVTEPAPAGYSLLTVKFDQSAITAKGDVMYTLPVGFEVEMQVKYVDARGNPATVDGQVIWASSDDDLVTVTVDDQDSTVCTVTTVDAVGNVQVTATADADLGAGTRQLITTCDISVVAGEAVAGTIEPVGTPTPIP
jgi:hypothetical protein